MKCVSRIKASLQMQMMASSPFQGWIYFLLNYNKLAGWHYIIKHLGQIIAIHSGSLKQANAIPCIELLRLRLTPTG